MKGQTLKTALNCSNLLEFFSLQLAGIYLGGYWEDNFYCNDDDLFYFFYNQTEDELLNRTAIREAFCSLDVAEFFETAKDIYGIDFLELTKLVGTHDLAYSWSCI